jgi:mono/diheme cytochrome c family protein
MALMKRSALALLLATAVLLAGGRVQAAEPQLILEFGGTSLSLGRDALLANPAATTIDIPRDPSYARPMRYRAVPLAILLGDRKISPDQVLETVASDGFVAMLPSDLVLASSPASSKAYLAIEPEQAPWPALPGKTASAGPFYLVWLDPAASGVRAEQWVYMVSRIRAADSPAKRWPALAVDPLLPAGDPLRSGQALFVTECLVCHQVNGAGSAKVGPDLNLPMNPTEYFQPAALRRYIRDPRSVRRWNGMRMEGFSADAMSDREIDLVIGYLSYMAGRKTAP